MIPEPPRHPPSQPLGPPGGEPGNFPRFMLGPRLNYCIATPLPSTSRIGGHTLPGHVQAVWFVTDQWQGGDDDCLCLALFHDN